MVGIIAWLQVQRQHLLTKPSLTGSGHLLPVSAAAADNMAVLAMAHIAGRRREEADKSLAVVDVARLLEGVCRDDCCSSCLPW